MAASTRARASAPSPPSHSRMGPRKRSWMATFSNGAVVGEVAAGLVGPGGAGHHRRDLAREARPVPSVHDAGREGLLQGLGEQPLLAAEVALDQGDVGAGL